MKLSDISSNLNRFSRGLGYAGKFTSLADWITEFGKAVRTENWRPLFVKTEAIIAGNAATALVALVFSILTGSALGIIGYGLLMAVTGALIDDCLLYTSPSPRDRITNISYAVFCLKKKKKKRK